MDPATNAHSSRTARLVKQINEDPDLGTVWRALFELREGTTSEIATRAGLSVEVTFEKLTQLQALGMAKAIPMPRFDLLPKHTSPEHFYLSADGYVESGILSGTGC